MKVFRFLQVLLDPSNFLQVPICSIKIKFLQSFGGSFRFLQIFQVPSDTSGSFRHFRFLQTLQVPSETSGSFSFLQASSNYFRFLEISSGPFRFPPGSLRYFRSLQELQVPSGTIDSIRYFWFLQVQSTSLWFLQVQTERFLVKFL